MALQQFLVRMAHNTLILPTLLWMCEQIIHVVVVSWNIVIGLCWCFWYEMYIFMLRSIYLDRLAAPHSFIMPVQELERSKNMLIPLHELGCSLPWLHVLELSILIIIIIIIILLHVTPVPAFPQWHAVVGIGWFSSGCSGRPGLFMSISCAISTTVNAGTRGPVETSQCATTSAATGCNWFHNALPPLLQVRGSGTTHGAGSFAANGTTRFLVLLRLGIVRLCLFHFPHVARSHVVQTKSELLGSCWRLSGILIDRARS